MVDSFLSDIADPGGALRQYLEHGCVLARVGNTLFAHGAVDARSMRFIPDDATAFEMPTLMRSPKRVPKDVDGTPSWNF